MKKEKLIIDNLAAQYLEHGCEEVFARMYEKVAKLYGAKVGHWKSTASEFFEHDITEMFDDAILETFERLREYQSNDFCKLFSTVIHSDFKSLWRKLNTKRKYEAFYESDGEESPVLQLVDEEPLIEDRLLNDLNTKKDADKKKLVNVLISDCDSLTMAIVSEYLQDEDAGPTAIGRKLGIHHSKVTRQLKKLSKRYDERQFGNIEAYLIS